MTRDIEVTPAELRASAHAADGIAQDMKEPTGRAVRETTAAAESLTGWDLAAALRTVAETWGPALQGLHDRTAAGAANLRSSADGHEWNDDLVGRNFEHFQDVPQ
ncbi:ESX-1 secretion-associated protein [Streptacidiphilus sp. ASG 303]|uniref:type VII secretion target n=1 Tax=Streptacidiphilus sp. ASG 303 TaxID=2896847 RepID=UPI001E55B8AF|nr:type VII secretion target [Streptacidiphilus sp. ASG 303]MCD0483944.1 ESX-1 secretion-associated protein [Streptacidiphilus sp. ASG 303]